MCVIAGLKVFGSTNILLSFVINRNIVIVKDGDSGSIYYVSVNTITSKWAGIRYNAVAIMNIICYLRWWWRGRGRRRGWWKRWMGRGCRIFPGSSLLLKVFFFLEFYCIF